MRIHQYTLTQTFFEDALFRIHLLSQPEGKVYDHKTHTCTLKTV